MKFAWALLGGMGGCFLKTAFKELLCNVQSRADLNLINENVHLHTITKIANTVVIAAVPMNMYLKLTATASKSSTSGTICGGRRNPMATPSFQNAEHAFSWSLAVFCESFT